MKLNRLMPIVISLVVLISLASIWFYPSIQDFMHTNPFWNGLKSFNSEFNAVPVETLEAVNPEEAKRSTLVVIPYVQYNEPDLLRLRKFVDNGGVVVVLDDYGYGNDVLKALGLSSAFSGRPLLDPLFCYRNERLPRITDFAPEIALEGVSNMVLDHATALQDVESDKVLAWSSPSSFLDLNGDGLRSLSEPLGPFPVAAVFHSGAGVILTISDPSLLISGMVGRDDNRLFIQTMLEQYGPGRNVLVDESHLTKSPLDQSKSRLTSVRDRIANPYSVTAILGLVVFLVLRPSTKGKKN